MIVPVSEVDGHERYVDNRRAAAAGQPQPGMTYWGKYVAHDNNRDTMGKGLALTHNMLKLFLDLRPQVLHDLHESVTLLYTSAGTGPYNTEIPPVLASEWWWLSQTEVMEMTKRGVPGVYTYNYWDGWAPNFLLWVAVTHNSIGRFYETQSYAGGGGGGRARRGSPRRAQALALRRRQAPPPDAAAPPPAWAGAGRHSRGRGRTVAGGQSQEWYRPYPVPPERRPVERPRQHQHAAVRAADRAQYGGEEPRDDPRELLHQEQDDDREGQDAGALRLRRARQAARRAEAADLMNYFRRDAVEVHTATAPFTIGNVQVAAGDYIVRLDQPYGGLVNMLLGMQWFPEQNPRPYDDTGWSFPLLRNLQVHKIDDKSVFEKPMALAAADFKGVGAINGSGANAGHRSHDRQQPGDVPVRQCEGEDVGGRAGVRPGGHHFAPGAFIIPNADRAALEPQIQELGLTAWATDTPPNVPMHDLDVPRIGYLHSWSSTQDEGWVRMVFDRLKIPYTYFGDNLVRQGNLRAKFDVIIYPAGPVQVDGGDMPGGRHAAAVQEDRSHSEHRDGARLDR